MNLVHKFRWSVAIITLQFIIVTALTYAQTPSAKADIQLLLDRAHAAEGRGRIDQAEQSWQQVLLSDPNNLEALAGMARGAKLAGRNIEAESYLNRIRAINPNDPSIARVESMVAQQSQLNQLQEAGKLATSGQYDAAMKIYRQVFGNSPPPGDWALAYYQTESATVDGKGHAIAGLRDLINRYPKDSRYQIALGTILTYNPKTRAEGREYLERHPNDPDAMSALRNSLLWDAANPNMAPVIRAYLKNHPDPELSVRMNDALRHAGPTGSYTPSPEELARRADNAEEAAAYAALNARRLEEAESRFQAILAKQANNPRALAGMGYVRMNQGNFGGAISYLEQAQQNGARDANLNASLATSRFWYIMGDASAALNENDLATAEAKYGQALQMKPNSPEAMEGLAGTYMKAQNPAAAVPLFSSEVKLKPNSMLAWRGLFEAQYQAGHPEQALETEKRIPANIKVLLHRDPEFLRTLASAYSALGRDADAQRILKEALDMPFPQDGRGLHVDTLIQYAELLMTGKRTDQAAGMFRQALSEDPTNVSAWQGLIRADHASNHDAQAIQTLESMDQSTYNAALRDIGFLTVVASIYQSQNQYEVAQHYLEQAYAQQQSAGQKVSPALELQLASVYMVRNDPQRAYTLFRQALMENPNNVDAWKGLLGTLHQTQHDREALAQIQVIPKEIKSRLESDVDYLETVGSIYNALGDTHEAMIFLSRVQQHYASQHIATPPDVEIQNAWLVYNSGNDQALYAELMQLGARPDLTLDQRRTVQTIWASYAVRRANQAEAAGNTKLALQILNAAAHAFPDNPAVSKALAGGYLRAGLPKQALLIYKTENLTAASAADYKAAIGAALAAGDYKTAENWLRYALAEYPNDPQISNLGAQFELAKGNPSRAVEYYNHALASLPPPDPSEELTDALNAPVTPTRVVPRQTPADLATLLKPNMQPVIAVDTVPQDTRPYLPSYANQYGTPPVQLGSQVPVYNSTTPHQTSTIGPSRQTSTSGTVPLRDYVPQEIQQNQGQPLQQYVPQYSAPVMQQSVPSYTPQSNPLFSPQEMHQTPAPVMQEANPSKSSNQPYVTPDSNQQQQIELATQAALGSESVKVTSEPVKNADRQDYVIYSPQYDTAANQSSRTLTVLPSLSAALPTQTVVQNSAEQTDVLPRYVPNAKSNSTGSIHPDIAAIRNRPVRDLQSQPPSSATNMGGISTPSEQDLHVVAYQSGTSQTDGYEQQYPRPLSSGTTSHATVRKAKPSAAKQQQQPTQQQQNPALQYPYPTTPVQPYASVPTNTTPYPLPPGPTDQDLIARNVPPLRGSYYTYSIAPNIEQTEREQTQSDLDHLQSLYSGWLGGAGIARYRGGSSGFDRLVDLEAPFEATEVLAKTVRISIIPKAVFLDSGTINPNSIPSTCTQTTASAATNGTLICTAYLGSFPVNVNTSIIPSEQLANGAAGELQLTTQNFGVAVGYTPYEFLVSNYTGRLRWKILGGPITIHAERDSVKDSQLSYAGLRDPGSASAVFSGNIWGGVIQTSGGARVDFGNERSGYYLNLEGGTLDGYHTENNTTFDGTMGAYWRVYVHPEYGSLNVGANFYGSHFKYNELGYSYGLGGYFSPEAYFLGGIPITWTGHYQNKWHYVVSGSVGVQAFQEDKNAFFPLDPALMTSVASTGLSPYLPITTSAGLNYDINAKGSYHIKDHWFIGGYLAGNNTNNYNSVTAGFFVRYLFHSQSPTEEGPPTGIFASDGLRALRVP